MQHTPCSTQQRAALVAHRLPHSTACGVQRQTYESRKLTTSNMQHATSNMPHARYLYVSRRPSIQFGSAACAAGRSGYGHTAYNPSRQAASLKCVHRTQGCSSRGPAGALPPSVPGALAARARPHSVHRAAHQAATLHTRLQRCTPGCNAAHQVATLHTRLQRCTPGCNAAHQAATLHTRLQRCTPGCNAAHQAATLHTRLQRGTPGCNAAHQIATQCAARARPHSVRCIDDPLQGSSRQRRT
jgi:hypothetical protein